jgi:hypothetical protein
MLKTEGDIKTDAGFSGFFRAREQSTPRSLTAFAIGAIGGLCIAGYGLFTAAGTSTGSIPPEDLALVNQRPILRSDFINQVENETGLHFDQTTASDRAHVLEEMIREELFVQRGLELDFAETDQTTRNALVSSVTQQATVQITTSEPTEAQLRAYYDLHRDKYSTDGVMLVRNLFFPVEPSGAQPAVAATAAQAALRGGMSAEQAMSRFGLHEAKRYDEDYYFAAKYRLGDALFDRIKDLSDGEISEPVSLPDGIHIVIMVRNLKPVPLGFEASRAQVFSDSSIRIADDYLHLYRPAAPRP